MTSRNTYQDESDDENIEKDDQTATQGDDDIAFVAKLKSSRTFANILKTIHFSDVGSFVRVNFMFCFMREDSFQGRNFLCFADWH